MKLQTTNYKLQTLPRIMLVDMNSFFASVEQQANPKLRGLPVGVCASVHETSCLIATSKEAKALGIKTGTLVYKAKKIFPKIILLQAEPEKYREVHRSINKIFWNYTDQVEAYSIDESFLDLSATELNPLVIGSEIKRRIRQEVGEWLTCSIGVGENKFLAKLACDLKKPDGLSIIWRSSLSQIYKNRKLSDLWGVAAGWERRLAKLGIVSPLQLLGYPVQNLISLFGKPGYYIWQRVNGLEEDFIGNSNIEYRNSKQCFKYESINDQNSFENSNLEHLDLFRASDFEFRISDRPKSFGHSWILNFRTTNKDKLEPVILRLAEKAARRMRLAGFAAFGVTLSVTLVDGSHFAKSKKLKIAIDRGLDLYQECLRFLALWKFKKEVLHVAVRFTYLTKHCRQLALFSDKSFNVTGAIDQINDRYGEFTVRSAILTKTADFAPDAIAFGR